MTDRNIENEVLETIREHNIKPTPRWEFTLKDSAIWISGILCILIGAMATSVLISYARIDDWRIVLESARHPAMMILKGLPYFWILCLIGFLGIAYVNIRNTKRGYILSLGAFAAIGIGASLILGVILYDAGFGNIIERAIIKSARPPMMFLMHPRMMMWSDPDRGMLAGTVLDIRDAQTFSLQDAEGRMWMVRTDQNVSTFIKPRVMIRSIGQRIGESEFFAVRISPWPDRTPIFFPPPR